MLQKYTILWKPVASTSRALGSSNGLGAEYSSDWHSRLTVEEFDDDVAKSVALRDEVQQMSPFMRTKLVEPLASIIGEAPHWGLDAIGATNSAFDGRGVKVAVLDTGIEASHPAFLGAHLSLADFTNSGAADGNGHGTHCAGTIFGRDVGGNRIGVARGLQDALIGKILCDDGFGDTDMLYRGLRWAIEAEADIISMSIGFDYPGEVKRLIDAGLPSALAASQGLEAFRKNAKMLEAVVGLATARRASNTDPLIIAAAGNESLRDQRPDFKISASLPAAVVDLGIGAVGKEADGYVVASFSNSNPDLVAPGVNIESAWIGGGLKTISGTSMACPHVAGVAALWAQAVRQEGRPAPGTVLRSHLISRARRDILRDSDVIDVGEGMATAP